MSVICYVYHDINNQKAVEYKKEKKNNNKNKKFNDCEKWLDVTIKTTCSFSQSLH